MRSGEGMNAGELLKQANRLKRAGKLDEAIALYHQVIDINPHFAWAYHGLGNVLVKQGNLDEAVACYSEGLKINPTSAWFYYSLGESLAQQGDLEAAIKYFNKAIEIKPNFCKFYHALGQVLIRHGKFYDALNVYSKQNELNPSLSHFKTQLEDIISITNRIQSTSQNSQLSSNQNLKEINKNIALKLPFISLDDSSMQILNQKLWNLSHSKNAPVLVVGMHNSGTSILAEILHESGLFLGVNMAHYESYFFSIFINNNLIMGGGSNWAKIPILTVKEVMKFKDIVGDYIQQYWALNYLLSGYNGQQLWGFKDPRLCVLLPLYLDIFPNSKVVHIRRNPDDVAASLCKKKKLGVGQIDNFDYWKTLTLQHVDRVLKYANCCGAYYELNYENLCLDSEKTVAKLFDFLGLRFTDQTKDLLKKVHSSRIGSYRSISK
ncbi:MAG: tetratricopeptide repeat protein [Arthrospira sp. SH-MAG29]|nr:tetratricopeptide repeat protein [Arthrospira sp. SH-MAG29]MBS0018665.1 tetratricopeptide repeat protein [Arthrospira sp. SH-MAG29]